MEFDKCKHCGYGIYIVSSGDSRYMQQHEDNCELDREIASIVGDKLEGRG